MGAPRQQPPKNFGTKLRYLRTRDGLTLQGLAEALGYAAHGYVSELEAGKKTPTVVFVLRAADFFGVSTDELLRDELKLDSDLDNIGEQS